MTNPNHRYRFEKKYIISTETARVLSQRLSYVMRPDAAGLNGRYRVSTLYFDDCHNTTFHEKLGGALTRDKYRVRYYDGNLSKIRLERKHKHGEMVYKEGALVSPAQYELMRRSEYAFMREESAPVFGQFHIAHVIGQMRPVVMVVYERQAYVYQAGNTRVTFDTGLTANAPDSDHDIGILAKSDVVMEIKFDHFVPSLISEMITGFPLTQLSVSKFLMAKMTLQGMHCYV